MRDRLGVKGRREREKGKGRKGREGKGGKRLECRDLRQGVKECRQVLMR